MDVLLGGAIGLVGTVLGAVLNERLARRAHDRAVEAETRTWLRTTYDSAADALGTLLEILRIDPATMIFLSEEKPDAVEVWLGWVERMNEAVRDLRSLRAHPTDEVAQAASALFERTSPFQSAVLSLRFGPGDVGVNDLNEEWHEIAAATENLLAALRRSSVVLRDT